MGTIRRFKSGDAKVEVRVTDFLKCRPDKEPFRDVQVLLVDPSCSGSGLPEHHLTGLEAGKRRVGAQRLRKLGGFQKRILSHALCFPKAQTVIYSTCSTYREE